MQRSLIAIVVLLLAVLVACQSPAATTLIAPPATVEPRTVPPTTPTPLAIPTATSGAPAPLPSVVPNPTPFYAGPLSPPCGVTLPALPVAQPVADTPPLDLMDEASLRAAVPVAAWPAVQRLLAAPGSVALVAFQMGRVAEGITWNGNAPMPLASVAKLITLVAYVEAVAAGELNPAGPVTLAELDRYYLPNFDLGAHRRAVADLREQGLVFDVAGEDAVTLQDVTWMMIRHSSNAAADYLHLRLGQPRIETTAAALGLSGQTAPCTFLGQFLMMANHSRGPANDRAALSALLDDPAAYGREVALLADAYAGDATFRAAERAWRETNRRPSIDTQRFFAAEMAPQGTAGAYATLMLRLAQNGLSTPDSSFQARRILEWPNQFEDNVAWASNVGYKNGSLPGVLTTAYYAYRWDDAAPVIVVLFFRDLPQETYRAWRNGLPHDELARWLLADPQAIPTLRAALTDAE